MTENKRFIIKKSIITDGYCIFDTHKEYTFVPVDKKAQLESTCKTLNILHEENQYLQLELDTHKHPLWSTREAERKVNELIELLSNEIKKNAILLEKINYLRIKNMRLKEIKKTKP